MLINLVSIHPYPSSQSIPLANAFLKSYALKTRTTINLIDFYISDDAAACADIIAETTPDAVGFSMYVWNHEICCNIASELRRKHPSIKIFCGGPEVTANPEAIIINRTVFDFIIIGEGEVPVLSICQSLAAGEDYSLIPGVAVPDSTVFAASAPLMNLDSIPSPYLNGIIDTRLNPAILWQLSRGCNFSCDFCFDARGISGVRYFSLERLESELRHFVATGVTQIFVLDSTFNIDPKRAKIILKMIRNIAPDIHFHFEVRSEFIDRDMAKLFAKIPCSLQIGLQSADAETLKLVGRTFNRRDFSVKVGLLNESGAVFGFDLIYGLPNDTLEGFKNSLDYALSLYPNHLDIFPLAVLPGTKLASRGKSLDISWSDTPPYIVTKTKTFSVADMISATQLATACDIFYTRGKAVAWFNAVVAALGLKPSDFLNQFGNWLTHHKNNRAKESDFNDDEIQDIQHCFLQHIFSPQKVRKFLPLVLDLVTYHYCYATVLLSPLKERENVSQIPDNIYAARFKLAPSARIVAFSYEINELLDCGEPQIPWMYENFARSGSQAVIYNNNGLICTESLPPSYIHLLKTISTGEIMGPASRYGLSNNQVLEFIAFTLQEGIVVTT